jgi:hypothetical protein
MPDIIIIPNRGTLNNPVIQFSGSASSSVRLEVLPGGQVSYLGKSGSLFNVSDNPSGSIVAMSNNANAPIFEVFGDNKIVMGQPQTNTLYVTGSSVGIGKAPNTQFKLDVSGSIAVTGSIDIDGSINGNLTGTASYALTASYAMNGGGGAALVTGSTYEITSSWALTASYVMGGGGGGGTTLVTGSTYEITSSWAATASYLVGSISSASYAEQAATAAYVLGSIESASYATNAATASYLFGAIESASYALKAGSLLARINTELNEVTASAIFFSGSQSAIRLKVSSSGDVTFIGNSQGVLLNISDALPASLCKVENAIGFPILEVFADDRVQMGRTDENALVVTGSRVGVRTSSPAYDLDVSGSANISENIFVPNIVATAITSSLYGTSSWANTATSMATAFTEDATSLTFTKTLSIQQTNELVTISGTGAASTIDIDMLTGSLYYYTGSSTSNFAFNFRASPTQTLSSLLSVGKSWTTAVGVTNGASAYYSISCSIDGTVVTPRWANGVVPTEGNPNSIDFYTFSIIKTSTAPDYIILASQTQYT